MSAPIRNFAARFFSPIRPFNTSFLTYGSICKISPKHSSNFISTLICPWFLKTRVEFNVPLYIVKARHLCVSVDNQLSEQDIKNRILDLTDKFMEAREQLKDAEEVRNTVYFSEDILEAEDAIKETLKEYEELLSKLSEEQKVIVTRMIGLKMLELKAQYNAIKESLLED